MGVSTTEWFPGHTCPSRRGWYECHLGSYGDIVMRYWHNVWWQDATHTLASSFGVYKGDRWRGLTHQWKGK